MKHSPFNETSLSQISRRLEALRSTQETSSVRGGWIKYMRLAVGMTMQDLAKALGLPTANIAQAERREAEGKVTVATLKKFAAAMECEFVYSFVPKKDLHSFIHDQALEKARLTLKQANHHMGLEGQKVSGNEDERALRLAHRFIEKGDIW